MILPLLAESRVSTISPNRWDVRPASPIDVHATLIEAHSDLLQAEVFGIGLASGGDQNLPHFDNAFTLRGSQPDVFLAIVALGPDGATAVQEGDPFISPPDATGITLAVELGVAPHVVVRVWVQGLAVSVAPDLFGIVLGFDIHRPRAPVIFFPRHVVAALEQQDAFPRGC
jgi:hypothetical protein